MKAIVAMIVIEVPTVVAVMIKVVATTGRESMVVATTTTIVGQGEE